MKTFKDKNFIPLTEIETQAFDEMRTPRIPSSYFKWLNQEILNKKTSPTQEIVAGRIGFAFGAIGTTVLFNLGVLFNEKLTEHWGLTHKQKNNMVKALSSLILIPRIALFGYSSKISFIDIVHEFSTDAPLPRKNNQPWIRRAARLGAYFCIGSTGIMHVYINYNYLTVSSSARYLIVPVATISGMLTILKPFLNKIDALFAKYSPGLSEETKLKRAALQYAMQKMLQVVRTYDFENFTNFHAQMSRSITLEEQIKEKWNILLSLAQNAQETTPSSSLRKWRGYAGSLTAVLASFGNVTLAYGVSKWLVGDEHIYYWFAITATLTFTFLCAPPTQRFFEGKQPSPNWSPNHAKLRTYSDCILTILAIFSSLPNAYWPLIEGKSIYEKFLGIPTIIALSVLYFINLRICLIELLDKIDRIYGHALAPELMDFYKRLESLPSAIAVLPDEEIDALISNDNRVEHPLLSLYHNRNSAIQHSSSAYLKGVFSCVSN